MDIETIRTYCLGKKGASEGFPFGESVLVFKVREKIFAMIDLVGIPPGMNLKCDPELAAELRERCPAVTGAYHMNKKHWNQVMFDGTLRRQEILEMIDHSYDLVVSGLKKRDREELAAMR